MVEVVRMMARGKKKPRTKRKMLYPMSSSLLQSGAQLVMMGRMMTTMIMINDCGDFDDQVDVGNNGINDEKII